MTAARQERKSRRSRSILMAVGGICALLSGLNPGSNAVGAATSELVVINRYTGLAIDGFDPVAYFVDSAPVLGHPELELRSGGATWRFHNEGNRAAFAANPDIYMPRFGGHDPVALSRGVATAGNPRLWVTARQRLYLFYSDKARAAFAADPDNAIAAAERNWPAVRRTLIP
jgi:hypothetical protein